jgi:hypothetical protein
VTSFDEPAPTVTGSDRVGSGALSVADPRPVGLRDPKRQSHSYDTQAHYGVVGWDETSLAVPGYAKCDRGRWSVADPRQGEIDAEPVDLPQPNERLVARIVSRDGTWHRPFTTLELAALQSLFDPDEIFGEAFDLVGGSDATKREWIGNAVPSNAARGMAETIGETLLLAEAGETFMLSSREIWVKPLALALSVDPRQELSRTLIRRIAMFWDWSLCQPLAVARRADGSFMVVDGQHRLEAARMRGDIEDLPCVVTAYQNAGDEAAAFVALNQQRRPLTHIDLFKAALAAEDESAGAIARLLTEAGLRLAPHTNFTAWKPGMVSNIGGIQQAFRGAGERATTLALQALARGFAGQVLRYAGTIFPGIVGAVVHELRVEGKIELDRMAAVLGAKTQVEWRTEITLEMAATGVERPRAAKNLILRLYGEAARRQPTMVAAPAARPAPAEPRPQAPCPPQLEPRWCDQCDRKVSAAQAERCASPFCKAKAEA